MFVFINRCIYWEGDTHTSLEERAAYMFWSFDGGIFFGYFVEILVYICHVSRPSEGGVDKEKNASARETGEMGAKK